MADRQKNDRKVNINERWARKKLSEILASPPPKQIEYSSIANTGFKSIAYETSKLCFVYRYTLGKKSSISLGEYPFVSVQDAFDKYMKFKAMVARGEDPHQEMALLRKMPTLREFCEKYFLIWAYQNKKTADDDESKLKHHIYKMWGSRPLDALTRAELEAFLNQILKTHSPATANRFRSLLSGIFKLAIQYEIVDRSPCTYIKKFKEPDFHPVVLDAEQTRKLLVSLSQDSNKIAAAGIAILILTGCRREEILSAKWDQVDFDKGTLFLPNTKNGHSRFVQLSDAALDVLRGVERVPGSDWVFNGRAHGTRMSEPRTCLWRALDRAGLPRIRPHSLRHAFACLALGAGVDVATVQQLLGHREIQTTLRYAKVKDQAQRKASNQVADLLISKSA